MNDVQASRTEQPSHGARSSTLEFAVVIPTLNERGNVEELIARLHRVLSGVAWEVIFVDDDSKDGTPDLLRAISIRDPHVRCLQRIGRRGLSSAVIEGMMATAAPFLAVMDADLQHDETLLPAMLKELKTGDYDLVVGSRYIEGGGVGEWSAGRQAISRIATKLGERITRTTLADPMSGFFALPRDVLQASVRDTSQLGFKILLDILASAPRALRVKELPFTFRERHAGESKLDSFVVWEYLVLVLNKMSGGLIPPRLFMFGAVGATGVVVHMAALTLYFKGFSMYFPYAQATATLTAMTTNFLINNWLTYQDKRLRGTRLLTGWLSFCGLCTIGAVANVGIATYIYELPFNWGIAGIAGILISVVWNYAATSLLTWRS